MRRVNAIDPARIHERLVALLRIPSVTGDEEAAINRVGTWLQEADAETDYWYDAMASLLRDPRYPGHEIERAWLPVVAGMVRGDRPGPTVLLTGHIDVVPAGDYAQWDADPFSGATDGDRVHGRGAADMKSGLIAALEAFETFAAGPRDFAGRVLLVAVPAEEDSGLGTLAAIRRGWSADAAVIPEPTCLDGPPRIVVAHAGAVSMRITVPGVAAHASTRLAGQSALEHFLAVHEELRRDEREINEAEDHPLMRELVLPYPTSIGVVQGGDWSSTVMDRLEAQVRVGVALGESVDDAQARVHRAVQAAADRHPWLREHPPVVRRIAAGFGSAEVPGAHPLVHALGAAAERGFGRWPELAAAPYGCDMAGWVGLAGVPTVLYGPGELAQAHAADESVSLDTTVRVARVLVETVEELLELTPAELALDSSEVV